MVECRGRHERCTLGSRPGQCACAQLVDARRHAAGARVNMSHQGIWHQSVRIRRTRRSQSMRDVRRGLVFGQRAEREARRVRAHQLRHARRFQHEVERRLAEQQDLEHAHAVDFRSCEPAQLFEHRRMHRLRILDHQQADAPHARLVRHEALQAAAAVGLVALFEREAELLRISCRKSRGRYVLALDGSGDDALVQIVQQAADQQALTAAVLGGDDPEARVGPQRVPHELQGAQVLVAGKEERVVVGVGERRVPESEPHGLVQRSSHSQSCKSLTILCNSLTFIRLTPSLRVIRELLHGTIVRVLQEHKAQAGNERAPGDGGSGGIRTHDQWIKSPVLYRLSYRPTRCSRLPMRGAHDTETRPGQFTEKYRVGSARRRP